MLRDRFLWRLYGSYAVLIVLGTVIFSLLIARQLARNARADLQVALRAEASMLSELSVPALGNEPPADFEQQVRELGKTIGTRLTVIAADGVVLADSDENPARMENHANRPEILEANALGVGTSERFSHTVNKPMLYVALAVRDNDALLGYARTALPLATVRGRLARLRSSIVLGASLAALIALGLGYVGARRVTRPISAMTEQAEAVAEGRHATVMQSRRTDEIGRLQEAFDRMDARLRERVGSLERERHQLEAILGSMVEGVVALDEAERVVHLNRAAAQLLQVRVEDARGQRIWELVRSQPILTALRQVASVGDAEAGTMRTALESDGRLLELLAAPIRGGGAVLVFHDLTELRRLEGVRRDFVANVSHELKTPVAAIVGLVETLLEDEDMPAETRQRFLQRAGEQARRLSALVNDLLALSRLEGEAETAARQPVALDEVTRDAITAQRPYAEAAGLELQASLQPRVLVSGDPEGLRQAIENLLSNAIRYTDRPGSVTVRLETRDGAAVLEVQDTGIGIEARHVPRIFERFYRVDAARSRDTGGTGLGLAIVKHVARVHDGDVSVASAPGRGTTFRLRIPLRSA
jgi:two-component system phosphate regulon sensor histidine kinase PhoR